MKLNRDDVDWMTPAEFRCCIDARNKNMEIEEQKKYELSRFNAWLCLRPYLKNESPEDLIRFDWEELQIAKITHAKTDAISKA